MCVGGGGGVLSSGYQVYVLLRSFVLNSVFLPDVWKKSKRPFH